MADKTTTTNWEDFTPGPGDKPLSSISPSAKQDDSWGDGDKPAPASLLRKAGDLGLSVAKGVIAVPEAAVGLADIATGGKAGKFLENEGGAFGFRPKQAKEYLSSLQSDDLQSKQREFQQADGIIDKTKAALSNPALITNAIAESVPLMGAGAVPARAALAVAPKVGALAAGAIGEGVIGAGSAAEQVRQETQDGLLTPKQAGLAAASGAATAGFGMAGGKLAQRLGIGDVDTMLAQGAAKTAGVPSAKSIPRQVVEGAIAEGWLEELPQSVSEQILQNLSLNKPWSEGVEDAAVMGTLAGMAMGSTAAGVSGFNDRGDKPADQAPQPALPPAPTQGTGPTLALPAPDRGVIQVGGDGTARTPAYQAPGYVGDVTDVQPRPIDPVREQVAAAAEQGGSLSGAALTAIDTGVTQAMQPVVPEAVPPSPISLEEADARDQAAYEQFFANLDAEPVVGRYVENDDDIPDFGAASNVSDEEFLRSLGATDEDIQDAIATARQSPIPQSSPAVDAGTQANEPAGTRQAAGGNQAAQGQVAPRQPDNFTGTPTATVGQPGATARPGPGFGLKDALAQIHAKKQQEAANAKAATPEAAPASAPVPAARPGAVEAAGVEEATRTAPTIVEVQDNYGRTHRVRQSDLYSNADRIPTVRKNGEVVAGEEIPRSIVKDAPSVAPNSGVESPNSGVQRRAAQTTQGNTNATQTAQAQQASPQPAQAGAAPAAAAAPGQAGPATPAGASTVRALNDGAPAQNPGAQAAPAAGAQGEEAQGGAVEALRQQLRDVEARIIQAAPAALGQGGGDIEAAMKSRKVPVTLKAQRKKLVEQVRAAQATEVRAFAPETGTLGIPRADMPQVPAQSHGGLVKHLNAQGIEHETTMVDAAGLKPTQAEFSPSKVEKAKEATGDRAVIVSSDGHIIDGHHQAMAAAEDGKPVKAIVLDAPVEQALEAVKNSPSAQAQPTEPAAQAKPAQAVNPRVPPENRTLEIRSASEKEPWQMTALEFSQQEKGNPHWNQSYEGKDDGAYLADTAATHRRLVQEAIAAAPQKVADDFIPAPDGGLDYGEITPEMGKAMRRQAGKIRLQHGVQNSNGTGWGLVHIEANHGKQISGLGFGSVQDFVAHVASSIQQVWQVPGNSQLLLTLKDGRKDVMYIQLEIAKEGDFYRVNSAFPVRQEDYESLKGMKKIWDGSEPTSAVTGQRPAFATAASASPESESSQGSSNARGQDDSVSPTAPAAQPEAPKLTPAEAKSLMEWQDLGQKDGVKTHALTFYESQADKDAKRGRMIVAKVSKGDRSANNWMVEGDDKPLAVLGMAKKRAEEIGMAKAVADGFVQEVNRFAEYDAIAKQYGYEVRPDGMIGKDGKFPGPKVSIQKGRLRVESSVGNLLGSYSQTPASIGKFLEAFWYAERLDQTAPNQAAANDRNAFTLQRLNRDTGQMESVTFERGEYVRHRIAGKDHFGEIDGISHARREFSVGGLWYAFGFANKAERPVAPKADTVPLSSVIDKVNAKNGQGLTDADRVPEQKPASKTPTVDRHNATMAAVRKGQATAEQFRASFEQVVDGKAAIVAELDTMTKVQLLREGGPFVQMRYANEKKADVVDAVYREMVGEYALGESVTYSMGKGAYESAVRKMVEATDADKLARYVTDRKAAVEEMQARRAAKAAAIENPQTLADFREVLNAKIREGMTRKEAFLTLTPQQRIQYDTLEAESTREARENRKRAQKTEVRAAGQTTAGEIVATKHTRDGYDLFVVKLADRLSKEDYSTVLASAKKLGGWYSAFRGNGAIPGFQFKDKANAEAFLALAGGDTTAAQEQVAQRRDAFEDDRSQTAVERLRAMADKLEEGAAEVEGQQRKTNTERRARFASAAMASAAADKAKAQTMRNIARAIEGGEAKFLDAVRTKSQVDMLTGIVDTAKGAELRAKYPSYADQEKRKGEPPTAETADFAEFPSYSAFRSDLATLGRQLLEVDGTKKLGQRLMSVADDVTDAYLEFAKANIQQVSQFGRGDALAEFASKDEAERAIKRSGLTGKAIVLPIKRGQNRVILSPSEAIGRGLWQGDGDKRITLTAEFGAELVEAIGRRGNKQNKLSVPWQFQNAYDRRKALSRIGIETPSEFRAALREFISLKEQAIANRTRELELQMVGRKADGLDFFPTSAEVADQMIEAADLTPDMAVLEPSAGMGHLADRIREAGAEPDVIEISTDRRALLEEKGYTTQAVDDFLDLKPREFYTFGDTFRAPDGAEGIMRGANGNRVKLVNQAGDMVGAGYYDRADLTGVAHNGTASGYDRIIMNPPFSNRRDAEHVRHAYSLLKPGGRIVAIMGEGVFFGQDKKAQDFREWLESVGGTSEKLPEGSFMDPSLPVNTSVNARMVVIDKPATEGGNVAMFSSADSALPAKPLSLNRVNQLVQEALAGIRGAPPVEVTARPADVGLKVPAGSVGYGVTLRSGDIYVFQSAMGSDLDVFKTVFHELFHRGVRVLVPKGQYVQTMLDLAKGDSRIQQLAIEWKNTEMGQKQKENLREQGYTGAELTGQYEALAIEEALAAVAEEIKAEGRLGSKPKNMTIRFLANWLAKLADMAGMKKLAQGIRNMSYNEAERFVMSAIDRSGEPVQAGRTDNLSAKQVKSAIGNNGAFDPSNADIRFRSADLASRAGMASLKASALDQIHQTLTHPGKVSLWDKTVGTMRHLAERAPAFKPVFESAQRFIDDVSTLANEAADAAPRLLPRVETLGDLKKKPITAADNKAIARPLFEGTLMWGRDVDGKAVLVDDLSKKYANMPAARKAQMLLSTGRVQEGTLKMWQGLPLEQYESLVNSRFENQMLKAGVIWTDAELKDLFNATPEQISLYREARQAIDRSIDLTARADMLRAMGADYAAMRDAIMEAPTLNDAMVLATEALQADARENPDSADRLMAANNQVVKRYEDATGLQEKGYAPLSRFGRYTVDVVDAAGERQYFGMFESMREANQMAAKMRSVFPGATVTSGTMSQEAYKLFAGITPETLEQFGNMLGLQSEGNEAQDKAFQEYIKLAKNNHSALKRLIHRQGIDGYSEDVGRVLASFVYSNARQAAGGLNAGTMENAINAIPKEQGELKDVAMGLQGYIANPQEEGQAVRGMLFAQYLGGSVASAFVNMTQPFAVTMPYLSQFGGMRKASAQLARAVKDVGTKEFKGEPDLTEALRRAVDDGTVAPQEIHQLMAQARGTGSLRVGDGTKLGDARAAVSNNWERVKVAWGQPFALAEQFNRRSTFIAAYRIAKEQGKANPGDFARKAVLETQFLYSKANKARWARGAVGGTLMTFKTYSVSYLELLQRTWNAGTPGSPERAAGRRAVAWAVVMLMLMGGAGGLPFAEDAEDLIDGIGQLMGYNVSAKQWRKELLRDTLGKELGEFVNNGVSGLPGAPVDVSGRLGMGNLIPGTGLFLNKPNRERDLLEVAGPAGDLVARGFTGARKLLTGDVGGAALELSPSAVRNAAKGIDMASSGIYKDAKGYKVLDTTLAEAAAKFVGFQPRSVAEVQEANSFMLRSKGFYTQTSSEIKAQWAKALFEKDEQGLQQVRERLDAWNRNNPDQKIVVKMPDVWKRVREMGKDRTQRIADTAPKALRQQMREDAANVKAGIS